MFKSKKGIQLGEAFTAVMMIVIVALLVIVSLVIFTSMNTATLATGTSATVVNESIGYATTAGVTLTTGNSQVDGVCGTITSISNKTNGVGIGLGNISQTGCIVKNTTNEYLIYSGTWLYSYPYTFSNATSASTAATTMQTNFSGYPALIGLVGTIIFLALVVGVLIASFAFGSKKGA